MTSKTLEDLFVDELKDVYDAEKRLTKALPKLAKAASSEKLRNAFESHLKETKEHVSRIEKIFDQMGMKARGKTCPAMVGLVEEGAEIIEEGKKMDAALLDAGLICAAQKVEHYEIATYGTLATWAEMLGLGKASDLLTKTLKEEKAADEKLTAVASEINIMAEATAE
jgi:ferritin-like metal-binding protein YciE